MNHPAVWDPISTQKVHPFNKPGLGLVYCPDAYGFPASRFRTYFLFICLFLVTITLFSRQVSAETPPGKVSTKAPAIAQIAIIIDDIGYNRPAGEHIINVPGALTYAVIPFTPFAKKLATLAHTKNKEVLLHLPMEATVRKQLDTGGLTVNQSKYELKDLVNNSLTAVPFVTGFNNHMGSLLTTDRKAMEWIMEEASSQQLFFVDSVTNAASIAGKVASEHGIPNLRRDVFLDNSPSEEKIHQAFQQLLAKAKNNGYAIGIAHPHPATIRYLSSHLDNLQEEGIELVSVSKLVHAHWLSNRTFSNDNLLHLVSSLPTPLHTRFRFEQ
ncbi:hypothetical protein A9Q81_02465 [Gammaproteobacteria bacterium 42_54_T18]|nr:hypothetical protein A9Q81_02465 [Gammaproteobacteria bacterium 42_54_T18]